MSIDNIPPVAHRVICVDFDGTIFQWGDVYEKTEPFDGVVEFMQELKEKGWRIVIFTSRMSPTWWKAEGFKMREALGEQIAFITRRLQDYDIPFDHITCEKVPAEFYIDDKAIRYSNKPGEWRKIKRKVLGA